MTETVSVPLKGVKLDGDRLKIEIEVSGDKLEKSLSGYMWQGVQGIATIGGATKAVQDFSATGWGKKTLSLGARALHPAAKLAQIGVVGGHLAPGLLASTVGAGAAAFAAGGVVGHYGGKYLGDKMGGWAADLMGYGDVKLKPFTPKKGAVAEQIVKQEVAAIKQQATATKELTQVKSDHLEVAESIASAQSGQLDGAQLLQDKQRSWLDLAKEGLESYGLKAGDIADQMRNVFEDSFSSIEQSLTDFVLHGKLSFRSLGETIKQSFASMAVKNLITSPLAQVSGMAMGGLGTMFGLPSSAAAASGSATAGAAGGLGWLGGVASLGAGAGGGVGLLGLGSAAYGAYSAFQSGAGLAALNMGSQPLYQTALNLTGSQGFAQGIGGATSLAGAGGSFLGGWGAGQAFGKSTGTSIGSSVGGAIGAGLGSFVPGIGTFIGGTIGSFLGGGVGSLFGGGGKKPVAPHGSTAISYNADKGWYNINDVAVNAGTTTAYGSAYVKVLKEALSKTGASFNATSGKVGVGYIRRGGDDGFHSQAGFEAAIEEEIYKLFTSGKLDIPSALAKSLDGAKAADALEIIASFGEARSALTDTLDTLIAAKPDLTSTESAFEALKAKFVDLKTQAGEYGIALSKVSEAEAAQLAKFRSSYNDNIALQIMEKNDPYQAALTSFSTWADELRREAETVGGNMTQIEELIGLKRIDVLEQFSEDVVAGERRISEARKGVLTETLNGFLDELGSSTTYGLSPATVLANAQSQFDTVQAEALAGVVPSMEGLPEAARRLLEAGREVYASGADYTTLYDSVTDAVTDVLGALPGFAGGGFHGGGLRIVGEQGPELELTGAARYWDAAQTAAFLGGSNDNEAASEIRGLRDDSRISMAALYDGVTGMAAELAEMRREVASIRREAEHMNMQAAI